MKRNHVKKALMFSIVLISFFGCNHSNFEDKVAIESSELDADFKAVSVDDVEVEKVKDNFSGLKIIKSSNVRYKVIDVKKATEKIKMISNLYNSYVSEMRFDNNLYKKENRFTLKVPARHFDVIMDSISRVAEFIEFENISTRDVTSEYIDVEARLKTKLEVKERYESILRNNAKSVEDLLDVEEKLQRIQEEIESSQGKLKYFTNKVAYSTIQVDLYETVEYKEEPEQYKKTFLAEIKEGFVSGWDIIKSFFIGIIYIWPLVLIGSIVFIFIRKRLRK